ncbi:MAG: carboxypeptidase-like regulatory domain-containing protein [Bacteroidetes bacterium]|nr:carboxypeptidase-like regulatory domain-containing protein [Bacteroidota bacterium]
MKNKCCILLISIIILSFQGFSQNVIKGIITQPDSTTPIPFVYVINSTTGHGQMSDGNGKFSIIANDRDSIIFSFVGYIRLKIPASKLYKGFKETKVVMIETAYKLNQVVVSDFKLKPYEKDYMKRVIQGSKQNVVNAMESPISALYMQFSQKGKEQRKLAAIFENIFIEEAVAKKFNAEVLRKLTGDETIDFEKFRKYCYYLSNDYIINHDGYDLYYRVMDCYYRWKDEKR